MSAAQPKAAEPSMEEILASIRRIISDDQAAPAAAAAQPAPKPLAPQPAAVRPVVPPPAPVAAVEAMDDEEIMDLAPKPSQRKLEPHFIADDPVSNDLSFADPQAAEPAKGQNDIDALMAAAEFEAAPAEAAPVSIPAERLVSPATDRMVATAFSSLAHTVLSNNSRTLDSLVEEMMRPMIKTWLDDNLPGIVERLVRAEIERVARGGR